jgi:adenylate kinase
MDLFNVPNDTLFAEVKRRYECSFKPKRRVVLVGAPGSGKGTQGPNLSKEYCWCHLATGDMLRAAVAAGTENGKRAKAAMDAGKLVSDDIVISIVKDAINEPQC